jgi:cytochrome c553
VRAFVVRAIDDEPGGAGLPHFSEGNLLLTLHWLAQSGAAARVVNRLFKIGHRLYYPRVMQTLTLLVAVMALAVPVALADAPAGEKKAELCVLCHRPDNTHAAPLLDGLPANYLLKQFELYKSGKRFGPAMQTNLSPFSIEDWHDIAEFFSSRPPTRAVTKLNADKQTEEIGSTIANSYGCSNCHGSDYRGTKDVPRLAGQLRNYLALHIGRLQRDLDLHPPMSASGRPIPPADVEAMATYFGTLPP